jgi:hypothetical protein
MVFKIRQMIRAGNTGSIANQSHGCGERWNPVRTKRNEEQERAIFMVKRPLTHYPILHLTITYKNSKSSYSYPEVGGSILHRNVGVQPDDYKAQQTTRLHSKYHILP